MSIRPLAKTDPAPRLSRADIARIAAQMLPHGAVVNLGIGIPSLCADFVPEGVHLRYQAENGVLGYGELLPPEQGDPDLIDASGQFTKMTPGMAFFDSADSFAMIRGGHIDATVLGALQVSQYGDLANWMLPSRGIGSIGGGMDLAANTKRVIVAMEHTTQAQRAQNPQTVHLPTDRPTMRYRHRHRHRRHLSNRERIDTERMRPRLEPQTMCKP